MRRGICDRCLEEGVLNKIGDAICCVDCISLYRFAKRLKSTLPSESDKLWLTNKVEYEDSIIFKNYIRNNFPKIDKLTIYNKIKIIYIIEIDLHNVLQGHFLNNYGQSIKRINESDLLKLLYSEDIEFSLIDLTYQDSLLKSHKNYSYDGEEIKQIYNNNQEMLFFSTPYEYLETTLKTDFIYS